MALGGHPHRGHPPHCSPHSLLLLWLRQLREGKEAGVRHVVSACFSVLFFLELGDLVPV